MDYTGQRRWVSQKKKKNIITYYNTLYILGCQTGLKCSQFTSLHVRETEKELGGVCSLAWTRMRKTQTRGHLSTMHAGR